ncbi:hypothetical protein [Rhodoferax fermentans]|uniref:CD-NTase associated protein 4-like DNA endonuclease domain-containing protein n=1 Tax=Rhodoferax fermentans TaxID=28066 RepID=A0A1T1ASK5_RHOFE|nr:hypothetical protein [Rhodoferax fermentans]MBK1684214.1 hypothetical protein [Rhodoferax fermentans]OOV07081.1 hypothetical protein RF819_10395 [Rhodoferax fermentans]
MTVDSGADAPCVISREAGDKTKGFRFQKLRAAIRFLQRIDSNREGLVHCAMELLEDSVLIDGSCGAAISGEENKYYGSSLSFNSSAIKNTVVAFLDLYFTFGRTSDLKLGVYASATVAQERISAELRKELGINSEQSLYRILDKLAKNQSLTTDELAITRFLVTEEYVEQYSKKKSGGFQSMLKALTAKDFRTFLEGIDWSITDETNETLEQSALDAIRSSRLFTHRHANLETYLLSTLLDELEKRSAKPVPSDRLLNTDTLKNIFNEILLGSNAEFRVEDPAVEHWDALTANDFRNLEEKILSVCPNFSSSKLKVLARVCALARNVEQEGQREMKGMLRRILDVCETELLGMPSVQAMTEQEVLDAIDHLSKVAEQHVLTLRATYRYKQRDHHSIKGAVLTLFDDCFLALDEAPNGK